MENKTLKINIPSIGLIRQITNKHNLKLNTPSKLAKSLTQTNSKRKLETSIKQLNDLNKSLNKQRSSCSKSKKDIQITSPNISKISNNIYSNHYLDTLKSQMNSDLSLLHNISSLNKNKTRSPRNKNKSLQDKETKTETTVLGKKHESCKYSK